MNGISVSSKRAVGYLRVFSPGQTQEFAKFNETIRNQHWKAKKNNLDSLVKTRFEEVPAL